jgi:hypothetical protein
MLLLSLSEMLIMPISPCPVNKVFSVEAIFQTIAGHCILSKTTKDVPAHPENRTFNQDYFVPYF